MSCQNLHRLHELQLCFQEVFQQAKLCKFVQNSSKSLKQTPESHGDRYDVERSPCPCGKSPQSSFEDQPVFLRMKPVPFLTRRSALARPSLSGRRRVCVSTPWTDSSPSPSSPPASLLWGIRLITWPVRLRNVPNPGRSRATRLLRKDLYLIMLIGQSAAAFSS